MPIQEVAAGNILEAIVYAPPPGNPQGQAAPQARHRAAHCAPHRPGERIGLRQPLPRRTLILRLPLLPWTSRRLPLGARPCRALLPGTLPPPMNPCHAPRSSAPQPPAAAGLTLVPTPPAGAAPGPPPEGFDPPPELSSPPPEKPPLPPPAP